MREILFKAKQKNWREIPEEEWWVYGDVIHEPIGMTIRHTEHGMSVRVPVDTETLCQYTGMKDKNGKRIWENDICEMVYDGQVHVYVIVWDEEEFDFKGTNGKKKYGSNFEYLGCCEEIVRIGNIFDNPELLGQDGEKM